MKKAFTLAEIMIVLTVIGVLTAILLPVAFQAAPDENVMKFKKANSTLGTMIRELVNSDRYYADGDLGMKAGGGAGASGSLLNDTGTGAADNKKYFCQTMADIMSTKSVACNGEATGVTQYRQATGNNAWDGDLDYPTMKGQLDDDCSTAQAKVTSVIISADNVSWFEANPAVPFGATSPCSGRCFASPTDNPPQHRDKYGFARLYKQVCIDVDGINKGEAPFGYGIRADGKIIPGKKADEWIKKSVQKDS